MKLNEVGEFNMIKRLQKKIRTDRSVITGSGDDCAVIQYNQSQHMLLTQDMIIEGVDFNRGLDPFLIGKKALSISLSDIAACGGIPRWCLVSVGVPAGISLKIFDQIFAGVKQVADEYKVNIAGGDLSASDKIVIDTSVIGVVEKKNVVLRSGACSGDIIFVTGPLGGSLGSLKHANFTPRIKESRFLVGNYKPSAMIDISDGFIQDLGHIVSASNAGALLYEELIPLNKGVGELKQGLYDGEDFELLFCLNRKQARMLRESGKKGFYPVGEIVNKKYGIQLINRLGVVQRLNQTQGFSHFRK